MKTKEKIIAIKLRRKGYSYQDIKKLTNVSKSTLSLWLRDIVLSIEQRKKLKARYDGQCRGAKANHQKRINETNKIIKQSILEAQKLVKDSFFIAGLMLYWAEGHKSKKLETVRFSNSDPQMIKLMMEWFRRYCYFSEKKFRVAVHIHSLFCKKDVEKYWSNITRIPLTQFQKTYVKKTSLGHRKNKLYLGTCNVMVFNKRVFRQIEGWKIGLLQNWNISPRSSMDRATGF